MIKKNPAVHRDGRGSASALVLHLGLFPHKEKERAVLSGTEGLWAPGPGPKAGDAAVDLTGAWDTGLRCAVSEV